ncbi:putative serine protease K12H4.7 isoform X1 [Frankliniella occidentalis]|uniref:Serine protease K12H4.7 isoform X1 n=1 Tax=Frankliniella occidentalis TaxID=133901 RepID=A0A9C6XTK7_FRAOC|nr:putative serine protease K12H4.7 isoform X1 [Frankliniella occidentalis]
MILAVQAALLALALALAPAPSQQASVPAGGQDANGATDAPLFPGLRLRHGRLRYVPPPPPANVLSNVHQVETLYFEEQVLDHFNPIDKRVWKQRYFARDDLYEEGGPAFIYIGGEGQEAAQSLADGALYMTYLARIYKAKLFDLEHRYYGYSHPTPDLSSANLQYLSADQALADLAYFIEYLIQKGDLKEGQKVAVFGGSYPGNLAAWARLKYPHLIHAAVSSSAPVHAEADYVEYMEVVSRSLARVAGQWCDDNVKKATDRIVQLLKTTDGYEQVKKTFQVASELKSKSDLDNFFQTLSNPFAGAVQYNRDSAPNSADNIKYICSFMQGDNISPDEAMEKLSTLILGRSKGTTQLYDFSYKSLVDSYKQEAYQLVDGEYDAMRQWTYQTCTEFGYFQTFSGKNVPFPAPYNAVDFSYQLCKDLFGDAYDESVVTAAIDRSNLVFGDRKPDVTNVIFVNGNIDPWHALGILSDVSSLAPAVLVDGGSHCADMNAPNAMYDTVDITSAHDKIHAFIRSALYEDPNGDPADF